jgi:iron(III) transport system substrate-binding protein
MPNSLGAANWRRLPILLVSLALVAAACGSDDSDEAEAGGSSGGGAAEAGSLTVYSGRSEELVGPLLERFEADTGVTVEVRYGDTAEMAGQIIEEGDNSPADVFYGQDAGALGALSSEGLLAPLDAEVIGAVDEQFRSVDDLWVGTSGRLRALAYNTEAVTEEEIPASILDLTDPAWKGRLGWAPTNGSFQAFVTALRVLEGDDGARAWLEGIRANDVTVYENNVAIVEAVAAGEIDAGFVNHYYRFQLEADGSDMSNVENHYFTDGDPGALVNVAGVGIVEGTDEQANAERLVAYLLEPEAQEYFATETFEIPLVDGIEAAAALPDLAVLEQPDIDLAQLEDLEGTLALLTDVGAL